MRVHPGRWMRGVCAVVVLGAGSAFADQVVLAPVRDNTLYENALGELSNGAGQAMIAGMTNSNRIRRALLAFDVSVIPAGSTIEAVTLKLNLTRTISGPVPVSLHRAQASWGEGTSDADGSDGAGELATPGDATWLHTFSDTVFWTRPGGDFEAVPSGTASVSDVLGVYSWSEPGMVADAQRWLDNPTTNFGWVIVGDETAEGTAKKFGTRESINAAERPRLTVTYTPPAGTMGACCLPAGGCIVTTRASCAAQNGEYKGDNTVCEPDPCGLATGACCLASGGCLVTTQADCAAQGGTYQGGGTSCVTGQCPVVLTPFVDALPIPEVAQPDTGIPGGAASYVVPIRQVRQRLHRDLPDTTVWGYYGRFPGPTIEATRGLPVTVTWVNDLRDDTGAMRTTHYLPVDMCPDGAMDAAMVVSHLHGGHVSPDSDGYPASAFMPGESRTYLYPNDQPAATLWAHDHAMGITRLNVMMGLACFYLIRDGFEQSLGLPSGQYEVPLAIQDRSFNADGSIRYQGMWMEHFFGDTMLVNGRVWPYMNVARGKYRFRVLNGCNSRTLTLSLSDGAPITVLGAEGGLLPTPATLTQITLGAAERADLVLDFEGYAPGTEIVLTNSAPAPYPGAPGVGVIPNVMKFIVTAQAGHTAPIPPALRPAEPIDESSARLTRRFDIQRENDACSGHRWTINGLSFDDVVERPVRGTAEIWSFYNMSDVSHPMHIHLVHFQVLDRQSFVISGGQVVVSGPRLAPPVHESGWKDTVMANPLQITRVIARFDGVTGMYPYHCHVLEHEDNAMMRQFELIACDPDLNQDGAADFTDVFLLIDVVGGLVPCPEGGLCDVNQDGATDMTDALLLIDLVGGLAACP